MNFLILLLCLQLDKSVTVVSGTLNLSDGTTLEVGAGTFIPSPYDFELSRRLIFMKSEIEKRDEQIKHLTSDLILYKEHWLEREEDIKNWYEEKYKSVRLENEMLKSWWNEWGETLIWCLGTAAATAFVTYEITENF